jgi:ABC-type glycerol-3-phosphate transport system substrate-binding protein
MLNRARGWMGTIAPPATRQFDEFPEGIEMFRTGNAAFLRSFSYVYLTAEDTVEDVLSGRVAFAPLPASPGYPHVSVVGGWTLGVLQRSIHQREARDLLQTYAGPAAAKYRALLGQALPVTQGLTERLHARQILSVSDVYTRIQPVWRPSRELGQHYTAVSRAFAQGVYRILSGEDAADVLPQIERESQEIMRTT